MKTIFTLIAFLAVLSTNAQWNSDTAVNTLVAESEVDDKKAIGTTSGMTYVVFWKPVGAPTNYELRLQVLDADGNKTLGADGMLVSDQIPMSTFTNIWKITVDAEDNLYIGCTGTGGGDPAYVFKMDTAGNHLWNGNGVNGGSGNLVTVLPLSTGGAVVGWLGSSGGVMQKLDVDGNLVWPAEMPIENGSSLTAPANFFEISGGDYILVFHTLLTGINSNLYAQRYDSDGVAQWTDPTQLADRATAYNRLYTGVQDGDVVYMGYYSASGVRFDSFLQRINSDGSLPWGINGSDFDTNQTNYELETEIAFESGSEYIYSICRYTDNTQSQIGEYVQKFDKISGARAFTDNAKEIFPIGSAKQHAGSLQLSNGTPFFIMEEGENNGASPTTLNAVYLDEEGEFVWPEETKPVATFSASKSRIHFTAPANGQSVAVFVEDKGDGNKIYAQNIMNETLGINDAELQNVTVSFNNPVSNNLKVMANAAIESVEIYNLMGQCVFRHDFRGAKEAQFSLENLTTGYYLMNVETLRGVANGLKIVKQ